MGLGRFLRREVGSIESFEGLFEVKGVEMERRVVARGGFGLSLGCLSLGIGG